MPEVCRNYCATAKPVQVIVAETAAGGGILGVVDGGAPLGAESEADVAGRKRLLREIGYSCEIDPNQLVPGSRGISAASTDLNDRLARMPADYAAA